MKRFISCIMVVLMITSILPMAVFAEGINQPKLSIDSTQASPGEVFDVNLTLENNPGIVSANIKIDFDEGLTLVGATNGGAFSTLTYIPPKQLSSAGRITSSCQFAWSGFDIEDKDINDGTILTLSFELSKEAEIGDTYNITVSNNAGDVIDKNLNQFSLSAESVITAVDYTPCDVNDDGSINMLDVVLLSRYIVDGCKYDPDGYAVNINEKAGDFNGDTSLNMLDVVLTSRYIVDGCKHVPAPDGYGVKPAAPSKNCVHTLQATEAKESTCTEEGNIDYWYCADCAKYFSDAESTNEITYADTVVSAIGHQNVTATPAKEPTIEEDGNNPYWYCGDCEKYFSDASCETVITYNDIVIPAKSKYSITYYLYDNNEYLEQNGVDNPNPAWYDPDKGLVLENLEKKGFRFDGWYDADGAGAELVKKIEPGESVNIKLYARWSPISYIISYKDETYNLNYTDDTYTVDKRKILLKPEQKGLTFVGWEDSDGVFYGTEIPKGTTGNLELTAKWRSHLYVAKPIKETQKLDCFYHDQSKDIYYFVKELGYLDGIPLEKLTLGSNAVRHNVGVETALSQSETVTIEHTKSVEIGNAISTSVYKSEEFSKATTNANEHSAEKHLNVTAEVGVDAIIVAKIGAEIGASGTDTSTFEETTLNGGTYQDGSEEVHEHSATLSYLTQSSITKTETKIIPADSPAGYYAFARLGTAKVYGIVAFNGKTGNYTLTTYSVLYAAYNSDLFFPAYDWPFGWTNPDIETLPFNMDVEEISDYVNNYIYVDYNGNGGTYSWEFTESTLPDVEPIKVNKMPVSEFAVQETGKLSANKYERIGYRFAGWSLTKDGEKVFDDEADISAKDFSFEKTENLEDPQKAKRVTLYAVWEPIEYNITYHTNGGTLPEEYNATYTVETIESINLPTPTHDIYPEYNHLIDWYFDDACTKLFSEYKSKCITDPKDIDLYAKWYTVYDSIDSTPESINGKVIIDWRNETDTDLLNHTNRSVNEGKYNRLEITNRTEEIVFIGDPEKTYTNFIMRICGFAEGQKLIIRFVDFNFAANESTAIALEEDSGIDLTVEVNGTCSIESTGSPGSIFGTAEAPIKYLTFIGDGSMDVRAGKQATPTTYGEDGVEGCAAVYADELNFNHSGTLVIKGGTGSDGAQGVTGEHGTTNDNETWYKNVHGVLDAVIQELHYFYAAYPGGTGGVGGTGGIGGRPIEYTIFNYEGNGSIMLYFGDGGDGGQGGTGGNGGKGHDFKGWKEALSYLKCYDPGQGGDAGDGGQGGDAGLGGSGTYSFEYENIIIFEGVDGNPGLGGEPGNVGIGGKGGSVSGPYNSYSKEKAADGNPGDYGQPGNPAKASE